MAFHKYKIMETLGLESDLIQYAVSMNIIANESTHRCHPHPRDSSACLSIGEMDLQETRLGRKVNRKFCFAVCGRTLLADQVERHA